LEGSVPEATMSPSGAWHKPEEVDREIDNKYGSRLRFPPIPFNIVPTFKK